MSGRSEKTGASAGRRPEVDEGAEAERTKGLIDPVALGHWMDDQGLPGRGELVTSRFISGGASNEIFEISRGEHRWALRRPPRGDYQFANVMYHHGAPARLAAVVDWEMGTVGDPLLDLAWVVMNWPEDEADRPSMGYIDYEGLPFAGDLLQRYAAMSGRDVDEIDYYVILARFKLAIVLEGGYARFVSGEADNPRLEGFGQIVLDLARDAAALAQTTKL